MAVSGRACMRLGNGHTQQRRRSRFCSPASGMSKRSIVVAAANNMKEGKKMGHVSSKAALSKMERVSDKIKKAVIAAPTAALGLSASAAASHALPLNELANLATFESAVLPYEYFAGVFGVLGLTVAIYVFLVKIELI